MNNYDAILDFGTKNLKLEVFDEDNKNIYSSKEKNNGSFEKSLNKLIRDAEKSLSTHISDIIEIGKASCRERVCIYV